MVASAIDQFTTVRSEGLLLPPELLGRIRDPKADLEGVTPRDYHLSGERINEAISTAWNRARNAWRHFKSAQEILPESDAGTTLTRERWLLPLFTALDYGRLQTATAEIIDGKSYPISHRWGDVPIHLVSFRIDLDKRTPGMAGAATSSPHSLMQMFLNRSREHTWGFVSNGYRLRILRDNSSMTRQAHLEFDLESMMEGEVYADFVLFWMICHQSRVEGSHPGEYWLERWAKAAEEQGTRALDQLRGSVERAIEALGTGFIKHPKNRDLRDKLRTGTLNKQDYYRQLLRLVYRMLLLFAAEDRDLLLDPEADDGAQELYLNHYSVQRVRQIAEHFRGTTHLDQFEGLRLVMRLVGGYDNGKAKILGLPILGSALFNDVFVADIINCKIANRDLLEAIRALAFIEDKAAGTLRPIDYKHLGPEELGGVYESLLELHPEVNIDARYFRLETAGGHDRKTTGSYFTPPALINALLDSALEPVLAQARRARNPEAAVLNLKVCDPACGSGSFLIAAAHRIAYALAQIRVGGDEPPPSLVRTALRQVIGNCIYGVDINPMSVELCKVNLWIEALDPGKPLSFLDHHVKVGNSLLGTTPALMTKGIPDDAFVVLEGDNKETTGAARKQNRQERKDFEKGQRSLFELIALPQHATLTSAVQQVDEIDDSRIAGIRAKEARWRELANDPEYINARLLADAWCAAFVWEHKTGMSVPPLTQLTYQRLCANPAATEFEALRTAVVALREQYGFFHWHIEFPKVFKVLEDIESADNPQTGWNGGFDCILGNPPWERIKIQEKEWFAERAPEIANAPNAAARRRLIAELAERDPYLLQAFANDKRKAEGESHFVRVSERYPLCGRGDVNTYTIFAETSRHIINGYGRVGMVVPSGIATDDTTKYFFQDLMETGSLVSLYSFENEEFLFPGVHHAMRFCLITLTGAHAYVKEADFIFYARQVNYLDDIERHFTLTLEDLKLINPDSLTCPVLRRGRDLEILKRIYHSGIVLSDDKIGAYYVRLIHLGDHAEAVKLEEQLSSGLFNSRREFQIDDETYLRLYESKFIYPFEHRYATFESVPKEEVYQGKARDITQDELRNPLFLVKPRYWVDEQFFQEIISKYPPQNGWLIAYRDITAATNERTCIATAIPETPGTVSMPCLGINHERLRTLIIANLSSFCFDYAARQKVPSTHLTYGMLKQLPAIPPHTYTPALLDFIVPRVLELSYTAWDLQAFAQDVGYHGAPFVWDGERRFLMRCELDALYFHLYQIQRDDVDYIMETFPIVKRKDEAAHGEYRTKRVILEMYDQMAVLPTMHVPAPKDESATYAVPDVSQWQTWLNPPPADPTVAHQEKQ